MRKIKLNKEQRIRLAEQCLGRVDHISTERDYDHALKMAEYLSGQRDKCIGKPGMASKIEVIDMLVYRLAKHIRQYELARGTQ